MQNIKKWKAADPEFIIPISVMLPRLSKLTCDFDHRYPNELIIPDDFVLLYMIGKLRPMNVSSDDELHDPAQTIE
ncbi:hypothetical protein T08_6576 [Trichinella sp. T8]|nr:hypothetical protein T08_6576 [Trichinella sp. T8]